MINTIYPNRPNNYSTLNIQEELKHHIFIILILAIKPKAAADPHSLHATFQHAPKT